MTLFDLKYYLIETPRDWFYSVKNGLKSLWFFRKVIYKWRNFDYSYTIDVFIRGLEGLREGLTMEEKCARDKKQKAIDMLISNLRLIQDEGNYGFDEYKNHGTMADSEISKQEREKIYNNIYHLLKGQDISEEDCKTYEDYVNKFDGSGIEGWWE